MLAAAQVNWGADQVASIEIARPGTPSAVVELRRRGAASLLDRGASERMRFSGADGQPLPVPAAADASDPGMVYNVMTALHLIRFADPLVRWIFFFLGLTGTFMAASGLVLWVVKREPERKKLGRTPASHRLVQILNVAGIAGMTAAIGALFWANRLIPADLAGRSGREIQAFFVVWGLCLLHATTRPHRAAWREQLWFGAALFGLAPVLNAWTGTVHLGQAIQQGNALLAGIDLTLLALGITLAAIARKVGMHRPLTARRPQARSPAATHREAEA
ncbi:iron-regulated membrane protein [Bordetella ansorpii]|uniref:Iron-regulated membrane protein n=1 Tax=Bordetella ansorpii TaxID=288768 RepID=A0A157PK65_9BORD|nr:iron-regulated membrane protein [Bordetella ansorpii]